MRPKWFVLPAVIGLLGAIGGQLNAQTPARPGGIVPTTTPAYSPFLNLLRNDNPTFQNYYGLVRPEVEFRGNIRNLQRQEALTQDELAGTAGSGLPGTGHRTAFLNTGGYFLNRSGAAGWRQLAPGRCSAGQPWPST